MNGKLRTALGENNEDQIKSTFVEILSLFFGVSTEIVLKTPYRDLFKINQNTSKQILAIEDDLLDIISQSSISLIKDFFSALSDFRDLMNSKKINLFAGADDGWIQYSPLSVLCREYTSHIRPTLLPRDSTISTFGSCFARAIHNHLTGLGLNSNTLCLAEELNNPLINYKLINARFSPEADSDKTYRATSKEELYFRRINEMFKTASDDPNTHLDRFETFTNNLINTDIAIYTLGTGFYHVYDDQRIPEIDGMPAVGTICPVDANGQSFNPKKHLIELSPEEIDQLLFKTWKKIKIINPSINFVYSVSPIPLHGAMLPRESSVLEFDAISKSNVRLGANLFSRRNLPDTTYWPSFEIVRWVAPMRHSFSSIWKDPRHLSDEVVSSICSTFVDRFFE